MASVTLYPPMLNSTLAAFVVPGVCRFYYSLSNFSSSVDEIKSLHIAIIRQSTGISAVNKTEKDNKRYRSTGIIILNTLDYPLHKVASEDNLYYVDLLDEDIAGGWSAGYCYKIQLRVGSVDYDGTIGETAWLNLEAGNFSEWSTYCTTKAIYKPVIKLPSLGYNNAEPAISYKLETSTLDLIGTYSNKDINEVLYSYKVDLIEDGQIIESSPIIYATQYGYGNNISYLLKTNFQDSQNYTLVFTYTTLNLYQEELTIPFTVEYDTQKEYDIDIFTVEDAVSMPYTLAQEEDQGRLGLYISSSINDFTGQLFIQRACSDDNFTLWEDIKIIECYNTDLSALDIVYDYTIESGKWYRYGVQAKELKDTSRSILKKNASPVLREFEFSYLLGENNQQLRLTFNNKMSNFNYNIAEAKFDTIGNTYPIFSRNGNLKYKKFPVTALISYNMDENELFLTEEEIYGGQENMQLYKDREQKNNITLYNTVKERNFRNKVMDFLYDNKPKLFKSPTEGNVLVKLMEISFSPNDTLNRLVYSFTANAYELGENSIDNLKTYHIL